jgi:hypothetical protein
LLNRVLKASDVSTNVNLNKILKSNLGYKELRHIRTSWNYLDCLCINVFAMIRQFGPPTFFVTFTTCVKNWLILTKTLKIYIWSIHWWKFRNKKRMIHWLLRNLLEMILSLVHVTMNTKWIIFVNLSKILIWYLVWWKIFFKN